MIQVHMTSSSLCYFVIGEISTLKSFPLSISGQDLYRRERTAWRSNVGVRWWLLVASHLQWWSLSHHHLKQPRSYLHGILKNPARICAVVQRRGWRESLFMSSVVELHTYGVCDTAALHDAHSSCTCVHLHIYPVHTYITYRLHNEVKVLSHARPRDRKNAPPRPAMTRWRVSAWAAGRIGRPWSGRCNWHRVADGGASSQNLVDPFGIRPVSGLGGRWPIRRRPGTSMEESARFWPSASGCSRFWPLLNNNPWKRCGHKVAHCPPVRTFCLQSV